MQETLLEAELHDTLLRESLLRELLPLAGAESPAHRAAELPGSLPAAPAPAAPARLGRVVSVSGGRVVALLERDPAQGGAPPADVQVGALMKIARPATTVFGLVEGLSIPIPTRDAAAADQELRVMEVNLLGELPGNPSTPGGCSAPERRFRRGVSSMPCLDDAVLAAGSGDTAAVYALPDRQVVRIGTVHQDPSVAAHVAVDDLLSRHFAILGTTGSGKSCALALLLQGIIEQNPNGHILLLDPHGEYGTAFADQAEHLTVDRLQLPFWILSFEEIVEVFFGAEKDAMTAEVLLLRQLILKARLAYAQNRLDNRVDGRGDAAAITVDTPTPYTLAELNRLLEAEMGRMDNSTTLGPYLRIKARLAALQADTRYAFLFPTGLAVRDSLASLLGQLFRLPTHGKPLCILDLVGVPTEVLNVVVAVLCRMAFDVAVAAGHQFPILLVCEEAHRYAPQDTGLGFEPAKRGLARIAKEGRKYGISLGVLSQRPSDLAVSILSQCSTVLAFRMVNNADQEVIQAALSDVSPALVTSLPLLGTGEAVVVGEGVSVPMRLHLARLPSDRRPRSSSAPFSRHWQEEHGGAEVLERIVEGWRAVKRG